MMEIKELKIKILREVEASENLQKLTLVSKVLALQEDVNNNKFIWEDSAFFKSEINDALKEADAGDFIPNQELMKSLKLRSWRSK